MTSERSELDTLDGSAPVPHRCPVCEGHGIVENGFYHRIVTQQEWSSSSVTPEQCRACAGGGIIFTSPNTV